VYNTALDKAQAARDAAREILDTQVALGRLRAEHPGERWTINTASERLDQQVRYISCYLTISCPVTFEFELTWFNITGRSTAISRGCSQSCYKETRKGRRDDRSAHERHRRVEGEEEERRGNGEYWAFSVFRGSLTVSSSLN